METHHTITEETVTALEAIYQRRAVRKFKTTPVKRELIEKLIEAGRMAPSAMNVQPWKFYILTRKEDIELFSKEIRHSLIKVLPRLGLKNLVKSAVSGLKHLSEGLEFMKEEDMVFHGAPVVIFIAASTENEWAKLDVGMCAQNIMLAAKAIGLDTCPVGFGKFVMDTPSYSKLRIAKDEEVLLAVIVGYGDEHPEVHPRKQDNVTYL
jgi:nitroreductase